MSRFSVVLSVCVLVFASDVFAARVEFAPGDSAKINSRLIVGRNSDLPSAQISLQVPYVDINEAEDGFADISVKGLAASTELGSPELPQTGALIAVPPGYEPELDVENIQTQKVAKVLVKAHQRKWRCQGPKTVFEFNSNLYRSQTTFPLNQVGMEEVGKVGDVRLFRVGIRPLRMNFASDELEVATNVRLTVRIRAAGEKRTVTLPRSLFQTLRASTLNGRALQDSVITTAGPEKMLIFVADNLKANLAAFTNWKNKKGIQTEVFSLTEAGGTKEAMQTFIQNYYDTAAVKPTYMLFIGNKTTMPAFKETTSAGAAASDYRMTLLSGSDVLPDAFYGRFIVDNATELESQIRRSIQYESQPERLPWYHDGAAIASDEGSNPSDADYAGMIAESLKQGTYQKVDLFLQGNGNATAANITTALNEGRSWISYFGHGSGTSWGSVNDNFSNSTVKQLTNHGKLPVLIDVACLNASWAGSSTCFGKAWVTQGQNGQDAGAVAFYGGSVSISWDPPAVMSVGIAKAHFEQKLETLGASVAAGQLHLIAQMGTNNDTTDNLKWYNLFGDPSLFVRTDAPKEFKITTNIQDAGRDKQVSVQTADLNGNPYAGLIATISHPTRGTISTGRTDANGNANLNGSGGWDPGTVLTVTGYNAETQVLALQ